MAKRYILSRAAAEDLEAIYAYGLQHWGYRQAESYQDALFAAFDALALGQAFSRPLMDAYRKVSVGSHFVVYRESDTTVYVTRVLHQRMDIETHFPS
ncbi:MAG: type II toxin-antitoxin system RelE/ParE family toxin [Caulobacteraceae bacterium]